MADRSDLLLRYFNLGVCYAEITGLLASLHNIFISELHLKRLLRGMSLFRRKSYTDIVVVADFIREQLQLSGSLHGYRWVHLKCLQHGLTAHRRHVPCSPCPSAHAPLAWSLCTTRQSPCPMPQPPCLAPYIIHTCISTNTSICSRNQSGLGYTRDCTSLATPR